MSPLDGRLSADSFLACADGPVAEGSEMSGQKGILACHGVPSGGSSNVNLVRRAWHRTRGTPRPQGSSTSGD